MRERNRRTDRQTELEISLISASLMYSKKREDIQTMHNPEKFTEKQNFILYRFFSR